MNIEEFNAHRQELLAYRTGILENPTKQRMVDSNDDRLQNLKRIAKVTDLTVQQVIMVLASKHWVDLTDMASHQHSRWYNTDYWRELISDVQNYMDLLFASVKEDL